MDWQALFKEIKRRGAGFKNADVVSYINTGGRCHIDASQVTRWCSGERKHISWEVGQAICKLATDLRINPEAYIITVRR